MGLATVAVHDNGVIRLSGAWTSGRVAGADYSNLFLGLSAPFMATGDPQRHEWRAGLNIHRVKGWSAAKAEPDHGAPDTKLGLGWRYRLSRHTWVAAGTGLVKPEGAPARQVFDISLTYAFERNLRTPQGPR